MIERRSLLIGLGALFAAPAIVKASSLMKISATLQPITQLDVLFCSMKVRPEWSVMGYQFDAEGAKIGDTLRIRLPADYVVSDGPSLSVQEPSGVMINAVYQGLGASHVWYEEAVPQIPDQLALAPVAIATVPVLLEKPVTRRFWSKG